MILALQLLLSLSILIVLHEMGHFIPAKLFKIRVEKFYLFFDPWFSLVKKKIGDTVYGIGWLPLGGYVKIAGMVDESMDKEQMAKPAEPWEFRSKPAWQRLIIMVGGVTVNVILGILIYAMVLSYWGKVVLPLDRVQDGVHVDSLLQEFGFRDGDKIVSLNDSIPETWQYVNKMLLLDDVREIKVVRDGHAMVLNLPEDFGQMLVDSGVKEPFAPRIPCIIDSVITGNPAALAGLLKGDQIVGVDSMRSNYFGDIRKKIIASPNRSVALHVLRNGSEITLPVTVSDAGTIGFEPRSVTEFFAVDTIRVPGWRAIPAGCREAWSRVTDYAMSLKFLFSKAGVQQMGGFISIAKIFPNEWDWWAFWEKTAWISLVLAFMNILPIPALDGGHVMFLIWEVITGKAVSQKILERAQLIGMMLLLGLIVWANGLDIFRIFKGG